MTPTNNLTSVTNPRGYTTTFGYDALNRLTQPPTRWAAVPRWSTTPPATSPA